jgi:hypothetical protein
MTKICKYCGKERTVRVAAVVDRQPPKYACDECFERGAGSLSYLPAKVEPTAAEPEPEHKSGPTSPAPTSDHDARLAPKVMGGLVITAIEVERLASRLMKDPGTARELHRVLCHLHQDGTLVFIEILERLLNIPQDVAA